MKPPKSASFPARRYGLWIVAIVVVATVGQIRFMSIGFVVTDTVPLIESSRIAQPADVVDLLTQPMMHGTRFTERARYFRPLSSLTVAIDHACYGLQPLGYHATNLLLHLGVVLAGIALATSLSGARGLGLLTGMVLAIHPVTVEVVPAIARRHDLLTALLSAACLLASLRWSRSGGRWALVLAGLSAAGATLSKEAGFLLPLVVAVVVAVERASGPRSGLRRWPTPLLGVVTVVCSVVFAWRWVVLDGLGGPVWENTSLSGLPGMALVWGWDSAARAFVSTVAGFLACLVAPQGPLVERLSQFPRGPAELVAVLVASAVAFLFLWQRRPIVEAFQSASPTRRFVGGFLLAFTLGGLLLAVLHPLFDPKPAPFLSGTGSLAWGAIIGWAGLVGLLVTAQWRGLVDRVRGSRSYACLVFSGAWLLLLLLLYGTALNFSIRLMYLPLLPFSLLLASLTTIVWRPLVGSRAALGTTGGVTPVLMLTVSVAVSLNLACYCPQLRAYQGWGVAARLSDEIYTQLSLMTDRLPTRGRIRITGLPARVVRPLDGPPDVRSVRLPRGYSLESWLRLTGHSRGDLRVDVPFEQMERIPRTLRLELIRSDTHSAHILAHPLLGGGSTSFR